MTRLVSHGTKDLVRIYLGKPEVYPIVAIISVALTFMTYKGIEHMRSPDVHFSKFRRGATLDKIDTDEANAHVERVRRWYRHKDQDMKNLGMAEVFSPQWWRMRSEVNAAPDAALKNTSTLR